MRKLNIVFILKQPYPDGMACSRRIHLYAKGLRLLGHEVSVLIPRATERQNVKNTALEGVFEGVPFEYTSRSTIRGGHFIKRRWSDFISPIRAGIKALRKKPDVLFLVSPLFYHMCLFKLVSMLVRCKYVLERNEVPFMRSEHIGLAKKAYLRLVTSFFDGIVLITHELKAYYESDLKVKIPNCIIPVVVDFSTFDWAQKGNHRPVSNRLVYTGSLLERKDGILTILKAFKQISAKYENKQLVITGDVTRSDDYYRVIDVIDQLGLRDRVIFTGFLSLQELNREMLNADMLLLCKPLNRQNKYNFPTKVGEYLTTGVPVLISNVGETTFFLKDNESAFMAEPLADAYARKMDQVISDREAALSVALKGREVAFKEFNYQTCMPRLSAFLQVI